MKHTFLHILSLALCLMMARALQADVIRLRGGDMLTGIILFQNEDVIVIQTTDGSRYQYPAADIESVKQSNEDEQVAETATKRQVVQRRKLVGMVLQATGGGAWIPKYNAGANFGADWFIGACDIQQKHIFIGGGIGYYGYYVGSELYSFIPLQVRFAAPILNQKHSPALAASLGYGFSPKKTYKGGIFASADIGYRYQVTDRSALLVSLTGTIQHGSANLSETINGTTYSDLALSVFSSIGLKVSFEF